MPQPAMERLIANAGLLLEAARLLRVPVVASEQYPKGLGPTVVALADRLRAASVVPIDKLTFSAADEPRVTQAIAQHSPRSVIVVGMETHVCVFQTVRELARRGYAVHVVADAVASRREEHRTLGLALCERAGAYAVPAGDGHFRLASGRGDRRVPGALSPSSVSPRLGFDTLSSGCQIGIRADKSSELPGPDAARRHSECGPARGPHSGAVARCDHRSRRRRRALERRVAGEDLPARGDADALGAGRQARARAGANASRPRRAHGPDDARHDGTRAPARHQAGGARRRGGPDDGVRLGRGCGERHARRRVRLRREAPQASLHRQERPQGRRASEASSPRIVR